jgi:predicted transcriptional regulator of viral defense system
VDEVLQIQLLAHDGVVGAPDLRGAGVSERTVRTAVRRGQLTRVRRGAYVDTTVYQQATPEAQYRMRVAAVLRTRPRDAASHHAALAVHALPLYGCDVRRIDTVGRVSDTTVEGALVVHPATGCALGTLAGVRVVSAADAVVQATVVSGLSTGVVAADAALYRGKCTMASLLDSVDRLCTQAASRRLARLAGLVDPAAESPGESLTRLILVMAGLAVRSQVRIADAGGKVRARVDLLVG